MVYSAEISRDHPTLLVFLIDQSASMNDRIATGKSKSEFVADVLNNTLYTLITACTKADGVRNYFDIAVLGYGEQSVRAGLGGSLSGQTMVSISDLADHPLRVEDRKKLQDDGAGGVIERSIKFPVWFEARANGGTPMCAGLAQCAEALVQWCDAHPDSYPPTILHVTDGESTDGDPTTIANAIQRITTKDGNCLLLNVHVSTKTGEGIAFPASSSGLPDTYSVQLFEMSSVLPATLAKSAADKNYKISAEARGYMFNADPRDIVNFFEIGTRPRLTADR